jgi:hypothetical protein
MAKISIYYDYFDDKLCPIWMLIKYKKGAFDWNKEKLYIPVNAPFERKMCEDFYDTELTLTITQVDMFVSEHKVGNFGINIPSVKKRINKMRGEKYAEFFRLDDIEQFIIQISDIEEVMAMSGFDNYGWM